MSKFLESFPLNKSEFKSFKLLSSVLKMPF